MKVLITGAAGQVGQALLQRAPDAYSVHSSTHAELDISDARAVDAIVSRVRPDLIINAAAYTAVDRAEDEPERAAAINTSGPAHLARAALAIGGCRLLHISTDYVFDGRATGSYRPVDAPNPLSVYGRTKLEGELAVIQVLGARAVVLRTAWIYAAVGSNFLLTMLRLMRERGAVRVVQDQRGTPTTADSVARTLWAMSERADLSGIWHWTDAGADSWYGFARAIGDEAHRLGLLGRVPSVTPISAAEYPGRATRPANSLLDSSATSAALGLTASAWQENLRATLRTIARREEKAT